MSTQQLRSFPAQRFWPSRAATRSGHHVPRMHPWVVADGELRRVQFSPSPNGKVREVSEAKKRALAGNNIFNDAQVSVVYAGIESVLMPAAIYPLLVT